MGFRNRRLVSCQFAHVFSARFIRKIVYPVFFLIVLLLFLAPRLPWRCTKEDDDPDANRLLFIGGHPRSGTTLMRVLLDVHPKIRCGPETAIIPRMLRQLSKLHTSLERERLRRASLYPGPVNHAYAAFIRTLIEEAGPTASLLCNKDPLSFLNLGLLGELFPSAKFIHIVRDGRAVVASIIKRKIKMSKLPQTPQDHLARWENITWHILRQCDDLGRMRCRSVYYENLVLRPLENMQSIIAFLNLPWDPIVLHHERALAETVINIREPSSSQVTFPLHSRALSAWADANTSLLPPDFIRDAHRTSWLLSRLGYAQLGVPPEYGTAETLVKNNTMHLSTNTAFNRIYA